MWRLGWGGVVDEQAGIVGELGGLGWRLKEDKAPSSLI